MPAQTCGMLWADAQNMRLHVCCHGQRARTAADTHRVAPLSIAAASQYSTPNTGFSLPTIPYFPQLPFALHCSFRNLSHGYISQKLSQLSPALLLRMS